MVVSKVGMDEEHGIGLSVPEACKHVAVVQQEGQRRHWTKMAIVPFLALVVVQSLTAVHIALSKVALADGVDLWFFNFYRNLLATLVMAPFAFYLERDVRPEMTWATIGRINLLAFYGIMAKQLLFMYSLVLVLPTVCSAVQNMTPICTFILASLLGTEKISLRKPSDLAKLVGTMICISGAVIITLYKGAAIFKWTPGEDADMHGFLHLFKHLDFSSTETLQLNTTIPYALPLGVLCVIGSCSAWAMFLIKQGPVLQKYPALLSMICITQFMGSLQMAIAGALYEGTRFLDFRLSTWDQLMVILYGAIITSCVGLSLQLWCVRQVGAFMASLFTPLQTLIVSFLAILFLGETLHMGVLIGGALIMGGFYIVIYAQHVERCRKDALDQKCGGNTKRSVAGGSKESDLEEPLLSD